MRLSKLQKLDPNAIDKCAVVFVPPLAIKKKRNWGVFVNTIAQFTNGATFIAAFTSEER